MNVREKALGPDHPDVALSLGNLSDAYLARRRVSDAVGVQSRAVAIEDHNAAVLLMTGSDEQKRAYIATQQRTTERTVSLHVQSAPSDPEAAHLALTTVLRRKGRVLDALSDSFATLRRRLSAEDQKLLDDLQATTAQLSALTFRRPDKTPVEEYKKQIAALDDKRQELEATISRRSAEAGAVLRPVTLAQVQAALPKGAALLELFRYAPFDAAARPENRWGKPRYVAYVLPSQGSITWVDLGDAALVDVAVDRLRGALASPTSDPRSPARELDRLVMQPVRRLLGDTRWLFVSPDAALNLIPFGALVDEEGRYLVERYALNHLSSGRDLVRIAIPVASRQPGGVIFAGPDFDAKRAAHGDRASSGERAVDMAALVFNALDGAAEEGRTVAQKLPGLKMLLGADATEAAIKALHGPAIVHLATHGFFKPDQKELHAPPPAALDVSTRGLEGLGALPAIENPLLRSGLALAGANRRKERPAEDDGILTALEASQLDLVGTRLVVLSACETGIGEARSGDGVYGLRRALAMAGAETQVMSLWKVADAATRELMVGYYDRLAAGGGRSEALRQTQLAMLQSEEHSHPYYWASFIASGNGAALDGQPVVPDLRVHPGVRGCGCEIAGSASDNGAGWALALAAAGLIGARRRGRDEPNLRRQRGCSARHASRGRDEDHALR